MAPCVTAITWRRHQIETLSALLAIRARNSPAPSEFPAHWINGWVNNREAGDLRRHRAHFDVIVMILILLVNHWQLALAY